MSAQTAVQRPKRGRWTAEEKQVVPWVLLFLSPWIVGLIVFTIIPMAWSLYLSFTDYDPLSETANFIGIANYTAMLEDQRVWTSLWNTVYFTILYVPLACGLGLVLALLLNRVGGWTSGFFRTAFYLPNLSPAVAVGTLFLLILNGQSGLLNQTLGIVGINGPSWLNDGDWVKNGIVIMMLWSIGGTVIIYFAALRNVPGELYEAAKIDGAGPWKQFLNVTVPMISGALFFTIVINTISSLQLFSEIYTMFYGTQQGVGAG